MDRVWVRLSAVAKASTEFKFNVEPTSQGQSSLEQKLQLLLTLSSQCLGHTPAISFRDTRRETTVSTDL